MRVRQEKGWVSGEIVEVVGCGGGCKDEEISNSKQVTMTECIMTECINKRSGSGTGSSKADASTYRR